MINRVTFNSEEDCILYIQNMTDEDKQKMINEPMVNEKVEINKIVDTLRKILDVF